MCEPGLHKHKHKDGYCTGAVHLTRIKNGGKTKSKLDCCYCLGVEIEEDCLCKDKHKENRGRSG